jgi:hypothetical protein
MAVYKVIVPFESLFYATLKDSRICQLPKSFIIHQIKVTADDTGCYNADLAVEATNNNEAKELAVRRIEEFLSLLALIDCGFRIKFASVSAEGIPHKKAVLLGNIVRSNNIIELTDFLHLTKMHNNVDFEIVALKRREQWSDWLKTALRLNYIAVLSHDLVPAFIIHYSALEVLTNAILGIQQTVLNIELKSDNEEELENKKNNLIDAIRNVLQNYGLKEESIKRLLYRIRDTQSEGNIDRINSALKRYGIDLNKEDVQLVIKQRGAVAHPRQSLDMNKLRTAATYAKTWVQAILRQAV